MKAIETRCVSATHLCGKRIVASDGIGNEVAIQYPADLNGEAAHRKAAETLRERMHWEGDLIAGWTKSGYVFLLQGGAE
jgi:hypothetical protein